MAASVSASASSTSSSLPAAASPVAAGVSPRPTPPASFTLRKNTKNYRVEYHHQLFSDLTVAAIDAAVGEYESDEDVQVSVPFHGFVKIPRKQCSYGSVAYQFSGHTSKPRPWIPFFEDIRDRVCEVLGLPPKYFNFVLVNKYRDGKDSISPHHDSPRQLDPEAPIVSVSLGCRRTFVISASDPTILPKDREHAENKISFDLGGGDLLAMWPPTNAKCVHHVPKQLGVSQPRVSLTFRRLVPPRQ